ncbi:hypothetical protein FIBSPDRAFT_872159 [Athelia psychrophila]|uniref:Uncharacterized protein n=1 Tax=Athelia psychrophila TaxID=1759441 RepID=A0A165ZQY1_9AGAM|nr:hypothetical protein FIBSPDRAFT_872159 [Fibularhizoctonia sp. CBS 109695]
MTYDASIAPARSAAVNSDLVPLTILPIPDGAPVRMTSPSCKAVAVHIHSTVPVADLGRTRLMLSYTSR